MAAAEGKWKGGTPPDGYRIIREVDARGKKLVAHADKDPDRAPVYDLIWDCARKGWADRAIVLELDRHEHRTQPYQHRKVPRHPRPFDANRVRQVLDNPFYAGLRVHQGEVVGPGQWPPYVTPEDFAQIRERRAERARSNSPTPQPRGRPAGEGYPLARVATCARAAPPWTA